MGTVALTKTRAEASPTPIRAREREAQQRPGLPVPVPGAEVAQADRGALAYDFAQVSVFPEGPRPTVESCPLRATPGLCPFGGACHTCPIYVQRKLAIGEANDEYEQEANRVAAQVMRTPAPPAAAGPSAGLGLAEAPPIVHEVLRSSGQPLDTATRETMQSRLGYDFGSVRVHTDAKAAASARAVNALAYTVGSDVVLGEGQARDGALLAHELAHVVQQEGAAALGHLAAGPGGACRYPLSRRSHALLQARVVPAHVSCRTYGLTNPNLTGPQALAEIEAADRDAITLAVRAEQMLDSQLIMVQPPIGEQPDATVNTILQEELGLSLTNPADRPIAQRQVDRFRRVRELLESGYLRYMCRGGTVSLVGCLQYSCGGGDWAFSCPSNRLVVFCNQFWQRPRNAGEQALTLLHEPFHVLFTMSDGPSVPRRADPSCFESFALRVAGQAAPDSCVGRAQ